MTIAESLTKLSTDIEAAYTAIGNKGGTVPSEKNTDNLATAIGTITGGGVRPPLPEYPYPIDEMQLVESEYGTIAYLRDDTVHYYTATSQMTLTLGTPITASTYNIVTLDDGFIVTNNILLAIRIGSSITTLGHGFLAQCPLLQAVYFSSDSSLTTVSDYVFYADSQLNCPLDIPEGVGSIGSYFLRGCTSFNQPVTLPTTLSSLGVNFMDSLSQFNQPVQLPAQITTIPDYFMRACRSFNQPISFSDRLTTIGLGFLNTCISFNSPVRLPETLKTIANGNGDAQGFLGGCTSFNQPIQLPASLTTIPGYFLAGCSNFNSPIEMRGSITAIGVRMLGACSSFTQPLRIPGTVRSVGTYFMHDCRNFVGPLTLETDAHPTDNYSLGTTLITAPAYATGVTLEGPYAQVWKDALPDRTASPYRKLLLAEEPTE